MRAVHIVLYLYVDEISKGSTASETSGRYFRAPETAAKGGLLVALHLIQDAKMNDMRCGVQRSSMQRNILLIRADIGQVSLRPVRSYLR